MPASLPALTLGDGWACAGVALGPHGARADQDHVGDFAQHVEHRPVAGPTQLAGFAAEGRATVEAGDEVRAQPHAVVVGGVAVEIGQFGAVEVAGGAKQPQLQPTGTVS